MSKRFINMRDIVIRQIKKDRNRAKHGALDAPTDIHNDQWRENKGLRISWFIYVARVNRLSHSLGSSFSHHTFTAFSDWYKESYFILEREIRHACV